MEGLQRLGKVCGGCDCQFLLNFYIEDSSFRRTKYKILEKLNYRKILAHLLYTTLKIVLKTVYT